MTVKIQILSAADIDVLDQIAPNVFDDPLDLESTKSCLADDRHHIIVAVDRDVVVGFVSAVHHSHPDKAQPEMWINEVGVAPSHQRQGIGKSMMAKLLHLAKTIGCREAWVLTERNNQSAKLLYHATGGTADPDDLVMYTFDLDTHGSGQPS